MAYQTRNPRLQKVHDFLVRAAETERGLPPVSLPRVKTLWPETAAERHVDYKPEKTKVTYCKPTGKQIDEYGRAIDVVLENLSSEVDRKIVWAIVASAAFRGRGPRWSSLVQKFRALGAPYPRKKISLQRRYEEALLTILATEVSKQTQTGTN